MGIAFARSVRNSQLRFYCDQPRQTPTVSEVKIIWMYIRMGVALPFIPLAIGSLNERWGLPKAERTKSINTPYPDP